MTASVFTLGKRQFVSGLFWQPLSGSSRADRLKETKSLAAELNFDAYIERRLSACVGFCNFSTTVRPGVMSAAVVVSKTLEVESGTRDFIFAAPLDDGQWLYVAQRDGVILSDGDQLFASEDEVRLRTLEDASLGEWNLIIAPAIWGMPNTVSRNFMDMLPKDKKGNIHIHSWWKLVPLKPSKALSMHAGKIIIGCVAIAMVSGGLYGWSKYKQKKAAEEAAAIAAMQKSTEGKPLPPEHPWKKMPFAGSMVNACVGAVSKIRLFPGNWEVSSVNCSNGMLTVAWKPKEYGWMDHLKVVEPTAVVSIDGANATVSVPLSELLPAGDEAVEAENDRLVAMYTASQRYGFKLSISPSAPNASPELPGQATPEKIPPDWKELPWKVDGVFSPDVVIYALDGSGFRMNSMTATWSNGRFNWAMEGIQYVKP